MDNKVTLVGESGVGKTSLCHRILYETTPNHPDMTITASVKEKMYRTDLGSVTVNYQDTQGFESCGSILPGSLCRGTNVILLVYSLDEVDSIKTLSTMGDTILKYMPNAKKIMVGNKYDLVSKNPKIESLISGNKDLRDADHSIKVSALTGQGVVELENMIVSLMARPQGVDFNTSLRLGPMYGDNVLENTTGCCKNI